MDELVMKKTFCKTNAIFLAITMAMLSACQDRATLSDIETKIEQKSEQKQGDKPNQTLPTEALKTIDQTLSGANKISNAKDIKFGTTAFSYELPKSMKEICYFDNKKVEDDDGFCTKIDIHLAKVEPLWIEQIVNKRITNDDNPKLIKFRQSVDEFVDEHLLFIQDIKLATEENKEPFISASSYSWIEKPELLPNHNNVAQIVLIRDIYMGGAHGMPNTEYLLFDMDLQTQIGFADVIIGEKIGDFEKLAYESFKAYLKQELELKTDREIKEYEETWKFELTKNFYFGKQGLALVYQPYEMGAYAQGFIEVVVPYDKLGNIIKVQYLPNQQL